MPKRKLNAQKLRFPPPPFSRAKRPKRRRPIRLKGLIGHNSTRAGGRSVYLCSALEVALVGWLGLRVELCWYHILVGVMNLALYAHNMTYI